LPTVVPRLVTLALVAAVAVAGVAFVRAGRRAPAHGRLAAVAPLESSTIAGDVLAFLWTLVRGAAALPQPPPAELGRRYAELLAENLGQPGFRELLVAAYDADARRDVLFGLLADAHRARLFTAPRGPEWPDRIDLAGAGRDHAADALGAALSLPLATAPHWVRFAPESYWRGETHAFHDRPAALGRLLEAVAAAGAEQAIVVSAAPPPAGPHELPAGSTGLRRRLGAHLVALETAALDDLAQSALPGGVFVIRPDHEPLGPFDFGGCYDARSQRRVALAELIDRGYADAYRQFIEPLVAAGAESERVGA
ncbi:MAG TPA: hypothetical protein VNK92_07960, partial [Vicinamibacterales bacterium]|nr:hypothetical protein [Vicinamibacterales bacterium]